MKKIKAKVNIELRNKMRKLLSNFHAVFSDKRSMEINRLTIKLQMSKYSAKDKNKIIERIVNLIERPSLF